MRRSRLLGIVLTFGLTSGTGCATTAQYMSHWAESADARTKQRAEFRDIEQEARKMALESERAARMAELEKDRECLQRKTEEWEPWAIQEAALHDWRMVLEAGKEIGKFNSREWIGDVDVPTSTLITMRDKVVPVRRQVRLFESIPKAEAFRVDGDHDAVVANADRFVPTLLRAVQSVVERSRDNP